VRSGGTIARHHVEVVSGHNLRAGMLAGQFMIRGLRLGVQGSGFRVGTNASHDVEVAVVDDCCQIAARGPGHTQSVFLLLRG